MNHRIFIAINLPDAIKKRLSDYRLKWPELPCRWTRKDNLHITLLFLGYLTDEEVFELCSTVKEVAETQEPFPLSLRRIIYGPPKKNPPRMIWAEGEKSKDLARLQKAMETAILGSTEELGPESGEYTPHITLGRIKTFELRQMETDERPEIDEEINLSFEVKSVEVMESKLKKGGPEYEIIETYNLNLID